MSVPELATLVVFTELPELQNGPGKICRLDRRHFYDGSRRSTGADHAERRAGFSACNQDTERGLKAGPAGTGPAKGGPQPVCGGAANRQTAV